MDVAVDDLRPLLSAAMAAHRAMRDAADRLSDGDYRRPSLLPAWSRGHVLAHWASNADGQSRMLLAAMRDEVAAQYPGGDAQRADDIEGRAARPARLVLEDAHAAVDRLENIWLRMPAAAWLRPTAARVGCRPAWMSVWARWRETEIHHVDLDAGYTHHQWSAEFTGLMLPRVVPGMAARLVDEIAVRVEPADDETTAAETAGRLADDLIVVRGPASAMLCWLLGRRSAAAPDLEATRSRRPWRLPSLRPWA